jgi:hypothetical protein
VLLDAHVTHAEPVRQLSDGQSLASLKEIDNRKPLAAANLGDKTLHDGQSLDWPFDSELARFSARKTLQKMQLRIFTDADGLKSVFDLGNLWPNSGPF